MLIFQAGLCKGLNTIEAYMSIQISYFSEERQLCNLIACWVIFHVFVFKKSPFFKTLSGIPSDCQTAWIQIWARCCRCLVYLNQNYLHRLSADDKISRYQSNS